MRFALLLSTLALACCVPSTNPPAPDASDGGPARPPPEPSDAATLPDPVACALTCKRLAALGCAEGFATNCVLTCSHAQVTQLTDLHTACLAGATTKAAARACGPVTCL